MPRHTTVSTCTAETEHGDHVFEIFDYSQHRGMGNGEYIRSGVFSVGGYDWAIRFYPDGFSGISKDYISVYLELLSKDTKVRASCDLRLVDQSTGLSASVTQEGPRTFDSGNSSRFSPNNGKFMNRSKLEASGYIHESNITEQLGNLLDSEEATDVTFCVGGETCAAHRVLLATRSPVFKAQLYGPMREAKEQLVIIEDMQPAVFRALLRFIYTDSFPDMDDLEGGANREMIRHLLVAADRYAVDRLKLVCQSILCKNIDVETVSDTLALAYQHNCDSLKDICLEFITGPNVLDAVVATEGFKNLKATCPSALVDALEKSMRPRKARRVYSSCA
ncbi:hypothetical protein PVAP13_6KG183900 [Panicum virgatum]|uniref:Uncharacterized protein n=1 Tax=Panicum virgatum TaxID=38727 RepID=A0A8T0RBA8_PANVG|nr:hypothetical protein PVAP13_6KG183900 [Panicum virgatum]